MWTLRIEIPQSEKRTRKNKFELFIHCDNIDNKTITKLKQISSLQNPQIQMKSVYIFLFTKRA